MRLLSLILALLAVYIALRCFDAYDRDYTGFGVLFIFIAGGFLCFAFSHPSRRSF